MENLSTGYTWDEAPHNLKQAALHLSDVLKIDKNITRLLNQLFRNMNKYKQFEPKTKVQRKEIYRLLYNKVNLPIIYQKIPFMKKPKKNTHSKSNDYLYMNTN